MDVMFGKREILCTFSAKSYYGAVRILEENNIHYESKIKKQAGDNRWGHPNVPGINQDYSNMYYLYVDKKDLEHAKQLLQIL